MDEKEIFDPNNPIHLLEEAAYYFNVIPRKKYGKNTEDSYQLVSKIEDYLRKNKNDTGSN